MTYKQPDLRDVFDSAPRCNFTTTLLNYMPSWKQGRCVLVITSVPTAYDMMMLVLIWFEKTIKATFQTYLLWSLNWRTRTDGRKLMDTGRQTVGSRSFDLSNINDLTILVFKKPRPSGILLNKMYSFDMKLSFLIFRERLSEPATFKPLYILIWVI